MAIDSVRSRLTLFWVAALGAALVTVGGLIYVLLARALYARIDENLRAVVQIAATSLANDLAEGQDYEDAARATAAELSSRQQLLAVYDTSGRLLAEGGRDDDLEIALPDPQTIPASEAMLLTIVEARDDDDRHRLAVQRVSIPPNATPYLVVAGSSLESTDEELESLRTVLAYVIPIALLLAGAGGWFLARQSLAPVATMVGRARKIGAEDLSARLPVVNPRDEHLRALLPWRLGAYVGGRRSRPRPDIGALDRPHPWRRRLADSLLPARHDVHGNIAGPGARRHAFI